MEREEMEVLSARLFRTLVDFPERVLNIQEGIRETIQSIPPFDSLLAVYDECVSKGGIASFDTLEHAASVGNKPEILTMLLQIWQEYPAIATPESAESTLNLLSEAQGRRNLQSGLNDVYKRLALEEISLQDALLEIETLRHSIVPPGAARSEYNFNDRIIKKFIGEVAEYSRDSHSTIQTGIRSLDAMLGNGFRPNDCFVLAARTGQYKTTLAVNILRHFLMQRKRVYYVSLEMPLYEIMIKLISLYGKITRMKSRIGLFSPDEYSHIQLLLHEFLSQDREFPYPFHIAAPPDDTNLSAKDIIDRCLRLQDKVGHIDALIVDHMQHLRAEGGDRRLEVQKYMKDLRDFNLSNRTLLIPLSQVRRGTRRVVKGESIAVRPTEEDLKEAGAIEEMATVVGILYYPWHYEKDLLPDLDFRETLRKMSELSLYIDKNRHGKCGKLSLEIDLSHGNITASEITRMRTATEVSAAENSAVDSQNAPESYEDTSSEFVTL